jgi:hypothetical protein
VSVGLIVIIRAAAANDEGTHVPDSRHGHERSSVRAVSNVLSTRRAAPLRSCAAVS